MYMLFLKYQVLINFPILYVVAEEMKAQKVCKQNKLMKSKTSPNNSQFKYLEKHTRKTKIL